MEIIGEKINGTRKRVAQAIAERDADFIRDLARRQAEAGAAWLDVNAGTHPKQEPDDLVWLIENVQAATDTPLCLDSANPQALAVALEAIDKTPLIELIIGEPDRLENILPLVAEHGCCVIALAMAATKIPDSSELLSRFELSVGIEGAVMRCLMLPKWPKTRYSAVFLAFSRFSPLLSRYSQ